MDLSKEGIGASHPVSLSPLPEVEASNGLPSESDEHGTADPSAHDHQPAPLSGTLGSIDLPRSMTSLDLCHLLYFPVLFPGSSKMPAEYGGLLSQPTGWLSDTGCRMHSARPTLDNPPLLRWIGCEGTTDNRPSLFVGAYTAVTRSLWQDVLQTRGTPCLDAELSAPVGKRPEVTSVQYPFTQDRELYEMYRNPWNRVRVGRVLEDMDSMAGYIAFRHCDDGDPSKLPPLLVTAAVERIEIIRSFDLECDVTLCAILLSGQVVYTGTSSMDIQLTLRQSPSLEARIVAMFTFVARDPRTQKATKINPLVPQTNEQQQHFEQRARVAKALKAARKAAASGDGRMLSSNGEPVDPEQARRMEWAQELLAEARRMSRMPGLADGGAVLMDSTRLSNTFTCQPQSRNMHGRIFGGFLMRRAYELAYATVHMFAGARPKFVQVDRVEFRNPVDIGDLLTFESIVIHAHNLPHHSQGPKARVYVEVEASVNRPEQQTSFPTNTFQFTFETKLVVTETSLAVRALKRVLPSTEAQARKIECFFQKESH